MVGLTSAAGIVGFLSEPDVELQVFALSKLNEYIESLWTEVAGYVGQIEALYEDDSFPERELAALVASKVYYHLQEYNDAMTFALGAGKLFDISKEGEYEDTMISKCIDYYITISSHQHSAPAGGKEQQVSNAFGSADGVNNATAALTSPTTPFSQSVLPSKSLLSRQNSVIDGDQNGSAIGGRSGPLGVSSKMGKELRTVIDQLFEQCFQEGQYKQVLGIAVEARNLDKIREVLERAKKSHGAEKGKDVGKSVAEDLLQYLLDVCMNIVQERSFRNALLQVLLDLFRGLSSPDRFNIAKCIVYLNEPELAVTMLNDLVIEGQPVSLATAYQIAFDMYDNSSQEFLAKILDGIPDPGDDKQPEVSDDVKADTPKEPGVHLTLGQGGKLGEDEIKIVTNLRDILSGSKSIQLDLEFLYRNNHTDRNILNKIKDSLEARNSIFHTAVSLANAFMHAGTTHDQFFRENLEWLSKAVNWSKFTATAALGVIHRGNLSQGLKLLGPYLPRDQIQGANTGSPYSQGGSLYALGLIYANHQTFALETIKNHFKNAQEEVVQHGGALGLGISGMATGDESIYDILKEVLFRDSALNGEAVGIAMGLVMLGTANMSMLEEMIQYAHETQHEKIVRGLALGMALIMYNRQEAADWLVNGLLDDPDPILRYGGIQTLALAYCGTSSNKAVRRLLHVAVSDVSDDVRRVAVMSLGFILFRKPNSVPRMVELLSESYNPHVRYGAAMALGISCAGTGLDEAIDLLEPMIKDPTDFVRQGALIALSMIMVQQNEAMNPKVATIRKTLQKAIGDRHEDAMTKFGSAVSLGIIDAGGRNCSISLQTQTGNLNMAGIVGMAVFTQYWYWFPLTHFLSLSFNPTSMIAVDQNLDVPAFNFHSATRPSLFDYPPDQETKVEDAPEKVKVAVLSTTAQAKRKAQKKEKAQRRESMDVDQTPTTPKAPTEDKMETDDVIKDELADKEADDSSKQGDSSASTKKSTQKEKIGYDLENMSRVLPAQLSYIRFNDSRYEPIKEPTGGVIVVIDRNPDEEKKLLEFKAKKTVAAPKPGPPGLVPVELPQSVRDMLRATAGSTDAAGAAGAADMAGVLTAVDEDNEGDEEAEVPREFEYDTDAADE